MEIIKTISLVIKLDTNETQTLSNVCEVARRVIEAQDSQYIVEFGEDEARNIGDFIANIFAI